MSRNLRKRNCFRNHLSVCHSFLSTFVWYGYC